MGKIDPKVAAKAKADATKAAKDKLKNAKKAPAASGSRAVAARGKASTALTTGDAKSRMLAAAASSKGHGFAQRDLLIPFVVILQAKSQPCVKTSDKFVDGAAEGMIYNNANADLFDGEQGIVFVPVKYTRRWTQWKLRGKEGDGGGFVKDWGQNEDAAMALVVETDKKGRNLLASGKEQIVESGDYYGFLVDPESGKADGVIISMTSSNWKAAKRLNSFIQGWQQPKGEDQAGTYNPEMYFRPYLLTTQPESNDDGDWMSWKVQVYLPEGHSEEESFTTFDLPNGEDIVNRAEILRGSVERGEVKVNFTDENRDASEQNGGKF